MISEIYIQKKRLDISAEISSLLTYNLDDVKDFSSRNTTFSKTIVLPGTANNNYLFGNIFDVRVSNSFNASGENVSTNFNAAVEADCLIFQNHIQVFKGTMRVLEIIITNGGIEYEVSVFGELGGLVLALGSNKIQDLDFSAYNTAWNASGITGSWDAVPGTGVNFPLIDYGTVSAAKVNYDIKAFRPALFVREYIDKIFTAAGYRWQSNIFDTTRFKKLVIPNNRKALTSNTTKLLDVTAADETIADATSVVMTFGSGTLGSFTTPDNQVFTYAGVDPVITSIACFVDIIAYTAFPDTLTISLRKNGVAIKTAPVGSTGTYDLSISNITFTTGNYIDVRISSIVLNESVTFNGTLDVDASVAVPVPLSVGSTIIINDTIPSNILQKDFLVSIIKLFNLYVYESNSETKKLYIEPYVDFFDLNVSGVVDWNYKMDRSRPIRIKPMSELNSRYYKFLFKSDTDYYNDLYKKRYNENYGDYIYDSEFDFTNESNSLECIFSPSVLVGYSGTDKIVTALYKKTSGVEETLDTNIRILQITKVTGVASWAIMNGVSTLQSGLTTYGYAGHYDDPDAPSNDIHFGVPNELFFTLVTGSINVTQFNVYWSPYMAEITDKDSKLLTAWFKLTAADIFELNFSKLIYCEGSYWRLNKIEDWNASQPDVCKVELLKVINTVY